MPRFGESMSQSQPRTCSRKKTLQRCKMKGSADNIVLIDVDSDNFPNVIIIDVPESIEMKLRSSRENSKSPLESVIGIEDDGSSDAECNGIGGEGGNFNDDASSSRSCPSHNPSEKSMDSVGDECQFVHERKIPLNLSKCKRTYSAKYSSQNDYGLNLDLESSSSESDCSDCEFTLREQWEKASLKRKCDSNNGRSGSTCQASSLCSDTSTHQNVEDKSTCEHDPEVPMSSGSGDANDEEENFSAFMEADFGNLDGASLHPAMKCLEDLYSNPMEETELLYREGCVQDRAGSSAEDARFKCSGWQTCEPVYGGGTTFLHEEGQSFQRPYSSSSQEQDCAATFSQDEGWNFAEPPCSVYTNPGMSVHFDHGKGNVQDKEVSSGGRQCSVETQLDHEAVFSRDKDEEFQKTHFDAPSSAYQSEHVEASFQEKENSVFPEFSSPTQPFVEMPVNYDVAFRNDNVETVFGKTFFYQISSPGKLGVQNGRADFEDKEKSVSEEEKAPVINSVCNSQVQLYCPDGDVMHAGQSSIINEREKLKETAEYKRAVEEEWASRQRQLQIQAEEAQRLRRLHKRRRAEIMRITDMERRQKLRVEEMRETQKKDEESMNLKEQLRVEIRNGLNKLEMKCKDLASLLRCLGIHVGGGLNPSSNEVHAAYKRALLKLHPDRASRADVRQQVEAEEKFKLISRMKDKL